MPLALDADTGWSAFQVLYELKVTERNGLDILSQSVVSIQIPQ